jgi:hypothetical protein
MKLPFRPAAAIQLAFLVWVNLSMVPFPLWADGGVIQFRQNAGSLIVTLFSTPVPLRAGAADLSVLVEDAATHDTVLDATVRLILKADHRSALTVEATRAEATNKLLYAARPVLDEAGLWQTTIQVQRGGANVEVQGTMEVLPKLPAVIVYWPYFVAVPVAIVLFTLNQRLKAQTKPVRSTGARYRG